MSPSIYFGQNSSLDLISKSHGRVSTGFTEQFNVDVGLTNKKLAFFNTKELLAITIFDGVSGQFGYLETADKLVMSAAMDISPSSTMTNDDPSAYVSFNILMNSKNESGVVEQATLVKGARISSAPETMAPRDEQHVQVSYIGNTRYKVKGGGVLYTRFIGASATYHTLDDVTVTGNHASGTLTQAATVVNLENSTTTRNYLAIYRNGEDVSKIAQYTSAGAGFSLSGTAIAFPSGTFGATDVWEVYTPYVPV